MKKRALLSVSDKENIVLFAKGLVELGYEVISTGGTLRLLQAEGIEAKSVESVTNFPEILEGRVKTLHPNIHGGLLAKRTDESHVQALRQHEIDFIDLVAVNLYPFKETMMKQDITEDLVLENIDIGGPTMLRAAAKNFNDVTVIVDPRDYERTLTELNDQTLDEPKRKRLAAKVFQHTAAYDTLIARYFNEGLEEEFPESYTVTYEKIQTLRYGENPHQQAAFYQDPLIKHKGIHAAEQLHGKELSYNNIRDANAALEIVSEYDETAVVAVKHMNPCGIGIGTNVDRAFQRAYEGDPISIFGGIIACNTEIEEKAAEKMSELFLEIIIAPSFTKEALRILTKKKNIRLLRLPCFTGEQKEQQLTTISGGMLIQTKDDGDFSIDQIYCPTKKHPTEDELTDLIFAQKAVKHVKSNAIVLAKNKQTIGIGAGQMNRIGAAEIAIEQAGGKTSGAVLASDAFFPMPDTIEAAAEAGVTAIIQPGGSNRDQDSIHTCDEKGIAMVFTGIRHFKH